MKEVRDQPSEIRGQINRRVREAFSLRPLCLGGETDLRVLISALCTMLLALCSPAEAQQQTKVPRIGY
jgi:hypothetical protein